MYTILYNKSRLRILVCTRLVSVVCVTPMTANAGFVIPTFKLEKSRYSFHRNDRCSSTHQLTAWQSSVSSSISCASLTTFYLLIFIFLFAFICTRSFPLSSQHQLQFDLVFVRILFFFFVVAGFVLFAIRQLSVVARDSCSSQVNRWPIVWETVLSHLISTGHEQQMLIFVVANRTHSRYVCWLLTIWPHNCI